MTTLPYVSMESMPTIDDVIGIYEKNFNFKLGHNKKIKYTDF